MRARILGIAVVVAVMLQIGAYASNIMEGTWKSTSGNTIVVPGGADNFDLLLTTPKGKIYHFKAHWVQVGSVFTWTNEKGDKLQAIIDPKDHNKLKVGSAGGVMTNPAIWVRVNK